MAGTDRPAGPPYRLKSAPRPVALPGRIILVFGGMYPLIGWSFTAIGAFIIWLLVVHCDVRAIQLLWAQTDSSAGIVEETRDTGVGENPDLKSPKVPVYAHYYAFPDGAGVEHRGISYAPGQRYSPGDAIVVEYVRSNPSASRIRGMRASLIPGWVFPLLMVHPVMGAIFAWTGLRDGRRAVALLRGGRPALGKITGSKPTLTNIAGKRVHRLTISFAAEDGLRHEFYAREHRPEIIESKEPQRLIYDRQAPRRAVRVGSLPGRPEVDARGAIVFPRPWLAVPVLIPPVVALVAHVTLATRHFTP